MRPAQELERLNAELAMARADLERRVEERTEALRASQARVIQQEKMAAFGLLAAGIAHEVGNPLAALSSLVQILKRRGPDPYTAEKLDLAARQLQRIERTIRELIDFSRPASTAVTRVRISEVVDEALGIAKYYQRTKQRTITTVVPDRPADGHGRARLPDAGRLNLVLNAIDATDDQGRIHVAAQAEEGWLVLSVDDDGRGISIADRCRLFQPFFTTKTHGTGLGLFVSRQILEDFAGTLVLPVGARPGIHVHCSAAPGARRSSDRMRRPPRLHCSGLVPSGSICLPGRSPPNRRQSLRHAQPASGAEIP